MNMELYQQPETFTPEQEALLSQPLDMALIKHHPGAGGKQLAYVTIKTVIDAANRIFGFGRWGYKVVSRERCSCTDGGKGTIEFYTADIELYILGAAFPFPGDGVGIVTNPYTVEMHEKARKEAVSDALKRALRHYGDQFGLVLYDGDAYVEDSNGTQVQVKAVPVNNGKQQKPRQVVDAAKGGKVAALPAASTKPQKGSVVISLDDQIKHLKKRALAIGLAHDADQWQALLKAAGVERISNPVDLAKVNTFIVGYEKQVQSA